MPIYSSICGFRFYAAELIYYARKYGKRVPEDLSVIGFDDNLFGNPSYLELTTIRQDYALRAQTAIRALRRMRQGDWEQKRIILPVRLVERSTVRKRMAVHTQPDRGMLPGPAQGV